ncbi:glycerate dehydrogenase, partial [Vibrio parahaemolyticus]|nr:glycerate dehydrogenase [Vibrio parahaemolyticus]
MSLPKVVFLDRATIPNHIQVPRPEFPHHWMEYALTPPEFVVERLADADIVISNKVV